MSRLPILIASAHLLLSTAGLGYADTRITFLETRLSMGNGRETVGRVTLWLGRDRTARVDSSGILICRLDRDEAYLVDDIKRTYTVIPIGSGNDTESRTPELVESGEVRSIGSWTAERYDLTFEGEPGQTAQATFWISTEIDIDWGAYRACTEGTADALGRSWLKAPLSMKGFPVLWEVTLGELKLTTELRTIGDGPPPRGIYEPPSEYRRVD